MSAFGHWGMGGERKIRLRKDALLSRDVYDKEEERDIVRSTLKEAGILDGGQVGELAKGEGPGLGGLKMAKDGGAKISVFDMFMVSAYRLSSLFDVCMICVEKHFGGDQQVAETAISYPFPC